MFWVNGCTVKTFDPPCYVCFFLLLFYLQNDVSCGKNSRWAHVLVHPFFFLLIVIFILFLLPHIVLYTSFVNVAGQRACVCVCTRWSVSEVRISLVPWHNGAKRIASEPITPPPPSFPLTSQTPSQSPSGSRFCCLPFTFLIENQLWGRIVQLSSGNYSSRISKYDCFVCVRLHSCSGSVKSQEFISLF